MHKKSLKKSLVNLTLFLETFTALFIIAAVIISFTDLAKYVYQILFSNQTSSYDLLTNFLGHALLMAVGVELVVMLINHTPGSIIEVLLFAIARKILIGSKGMTDFILGILAIAGVFAIRKYLFVEDISGRRGIVLSAITPIKEVNRLVGINLPEDYANTIGGLLSRYAKEHNLELREGVKLTIYNAEVEIAKMTGSLIEKVRFNRELDEEE
ncbi:MAG: transporter associated domain-containing protein [Thermoanaerobacteraceae bacterium]|nr:transporter associated domain-containing protein [Thermoanaerobacteraceae bacterium]